MAERRTEMVAESVVVLVEHKPTLEISAQYCDQSVIEARRP